MKRNELIMLCAAKLLANWSNTDQHITDAVAAARKLYNETERQARVNRDSGNIEAFST